MTQVLFFDPVCREPYDTRTLKSQALGGTESTLVRVADALEAFVVQHNRVETYGRYRPPVPDPRITHVIVTRESRAIPAVQELYPHARVFLWLHDRLRPGSKRGRRLARTARLLSELAVTVICVSDTQRSGVEAALRGMRINDRVQAHTIYNPIDDGLAPDGSRIDPCKLVFFSSPNKGLSFTLDAFRALRRRIPDLKLVVGNPGYKVRARARIPGVEYLGAQPQARIHEEVRTALCTFFPNFVIPETFGLVFAESKALGTPVLTCDCGAALEVLADPEQVLPVTIGQRLYQGVLKGLAPAFRGGPARLADRFGLFDPYFERIDAWRSGMRPTTVPDPRFRLSAVIKRWRGLLLA
jgi:glycosyltransferase involved in cell wall biosynthesis